jgi:arylsulfatase A-like enzyme
MNTNDDHASAPRSTAWLRLLKRGLAGWCGLGLMCAHAFGAQSLSRAQMPPNIVFILARNLGTNDLGCYGSTSASTPNLDRLASSGVRFTRCYTGSPLTLPARASLLTGWHTGHAPIRGLEPAMITRQDTTVAEVLKRYGYHTGVLGLWGLAPPDTAGIPNLKGFDDWLGFLSPDHAQLFYPKHLWRNQKLMILQNNVDQAQSTSCHELFVRASTNFITINRDNPFFLYLAYTIPGHFPPVTSAVSAPSENKIPNRATLLRWLDREVGVLVDLLDAYRLKSNTVVFFSSDGADAVETYQSSNTNSPVLKIGPDHLAERRLRVPMLVSWPRVFPSSRVSDFPWAFWDFLPTAADIALATRPEDLDGLSVLPTLLGKPQKPHDFFYWEIPGPTLLQAVCQEHWKAVRSTPGDTKRLFHLGNDPGEATNVMELHPDVWARLTNLMSQARTVPRFTPPRSE